MKVRLIEISSRRLLRIDTEGGEAPAQLIPVLKKYSPEYDIKIFHLKERKENKQGGDQVEAESAPRELSDKELEFRFYRQKRSFPATLESRHGQLMAILDIQFDIGKRRTCTRAEIDRWFGVCKVPLSKDMRSFVDSVVEMEPTLLKFLDWNTIEILEHGFLNYFRQLGDEARYRKELRLKWKRRTLLIDADDGVMLLE